MPVTFAKPQLLAFDNNPVTDHNRGQLGISVERIEEKQRMANGVLRKYVVADKRTFSISWEDVPHSEDHTVDGFWGGEEIKAFYDANAGEFDLLISMDDGDTETVTVMFSDFSYDVKKRGVFNFWDLDISLEEV